MSQTDAELQKFDDANKAEQEQKEAVEKAARDAKRKEQEVERTL